MATPEITIMGAGVFGLSIAHVCAQRGARVQVIDPGGVGSGASGGLVGALAPHVPEQWNPKKAFQLDSLLMAKAFWHEVATLSGLETGYVRSGRVQPLATAQAVELAHERAVSARSLWGDAAVWEVCDLADQPFCPPSASGLWVRDSLSALIHPRKAVQALAEAVRAQGGAIRRDGQATGRVVWATGWQGLREMTATHTRMVGAGIKGQAALLRHDARGVPQVFAEGLHIIPHLDGTVAVGSTTERDFDDGSATDTQVEDLIAQARAVLPELAVAPVLERWAGVRPRSRSRAPMLGPHPFRPGEFVANGGFKIGFGMAPKVAHVMADLVLEGRDAIPPGFEAHANL